jgi:hypothetical protein
MPKMMRRLRSSSSMLTRPLAALVRASAICASVGCSAHSAQDVTDACAGVGPEAMYSKMLTRLWQICAHGPSHAEHILVASVGLEIHLPGDSGGCDTRQRLQITTLTSFHHINYAAQRWQHPHTFHMLVHCSDGHVTGPLGGGFKLSVLRTESKVQHKLLIVLMADKHAREELFANIYCTNLLLVNPLGQGRGVTAQRTRCVTVHCAPVPQKILQRHLGFQPCILRPLCHDGLVARSCCTCSRGPPLRELRSAHACQSATPRS